MTTATTPVSILSLDLAKIAVASFDLKEALALVPRATERWWRIRDLDWIGDVQAEELCGRMPSAHEGITIRGSELIRLATHVTQTVEGEFWAFPPQIDPATITDDEIGSQGFLDGRAEMGIRFVDGTIIDVFAKNPQELASFQSLPFANVEDPMSYFP